MGSTWWPQRGEAYRGSEPKQGEGSTPIGALSRGESGPQEGEAGWHLGLELSGVRRHPHPRAACRALLEPSGVRGFPHVGLSRYQLTEPRQGVMFREDEDWHGCSEPELAVESISTRGDPVRAVTAVEGSRLRQGVAWLGMSGPCG